MGYSGGSSGGSRYGQQQGYGGGYGGGYGYGGGGGYGQQQLYGGGNYATPRPARYPDGGYGGGNNMLSNFGYGNYGPPDFGRPRRAEGYEGYGPPNGGYGDYIRPPKGGYSVPGTGSWDMEPWRPGEVHAYPATPIGQMPGSLQPGRQMPVSYAGQIPQGGRGGVGYNQSGGQMPQNPISTYQLPPGTGGVKGPADVQEPPSGGGGHGASGNAMRPQRPVSYAGNPQMDQDENEKKAAAMYGMYPR